MSVSSFIIISILLSGCSSFSSKKQESPEMISIQTTIDLAKQSYIKGCMEAHKDQKNTHQACLEKSNKYLKENIHEILNQN